MSRPLAPLNGTPSVSSVAANGVNLSTLPTIPKSVAFREAVPKGLPSVRTTAMGEGSVGLTPDQVKALATTYLPVAQNTVDAAYGQYIKSAPKLELKFWTPQQLSAAKKNNADSLFAFVDNKAPNTVNVAYQSPIFKKFNIDANDAKKLLFHEVLHTRSAAFANNIAQTYGAPLADGKAARFSDGSPVRGVTEGLTEIFTMQALKVDSTPTGYSRETKWALKLIDKVGIETAKKAYFGNDVASMVQVKKAINELVAADKQSPEPAARSSTAPPSARSLSIGRDRTV
jgi:hypothetical protein